MTAGLKLSEDPLQQAKRALGRIRKLTRNSMIVPIPVLAIATGGFFQLNPYGYMNRFLVLTFIIFATGEIMAMFQMREVLQGVRSAGQAVAVLPAAGQEPNLI